MPKEKPDWEKLEIICAEIQKQIEPKAIVRHNHWVKGKKTGRRRKLDISISQTVSSCPVFIIVDCKRHKKAVEMKDIYAFAGQIEDVNAHLGIMISTSGFDAGAIAVAKEKNIILRTYRTPTETDWKKIVGNKVWSFITFHNFMIEEPYIEISNLKYAVEPNICVFNSKGENLGTIYELFFNTWKNAIHSIGEFDLEIIPDPDPLFIQIKESQNLIEIQKLIAKSNIKANKYIVNLVLANGNIIEDFHTGKIIYKEVISEGFNWKELIKNQQGREVTIEEYEEDKKNNSLFAEITNAKEWLRLII